MATGVTGIAGRDALSPAGQEFDADTGIVMIRRRRTADNRAKAILSKKPHVQAPELVQVSLSSFCFLLLFECLLLYIATEL